MATKEKTGAFLRVQELLEGLVDNKDIHIEGLCELWRELGHAVSEYAHKNSGSALDLLRLMSATIHHEMLYDRSAYTPEMLVHLSMFRAFFSAWEAEQVVKNAKEWAEYQRKNP